MSQTQKNTTPPDVFPAGGNLQANLLGGGAMPPDLVEMQRKILELQYNQLKQNSDQTEEQTRIALNARKQGAFDMQAKREREEAIQGHCPHMKPNFTPAISGQRDHLHHYHWICAYCAKEWTDGALPAHLRVPMDIIGGPEA